MINRPLATGTLVALVALLSILGGAQANASTDTGRHEEVSAERITACVTNGVALTCFDTEADLDSYLAKKPTTGDSGSASAACSTPLRLYTGTNHTGSVLAVSSRGVWVNLAAGFSNQISSYRVGACSSRFADGTNGTNGFYPGSTGAWVNATQILATWDNRVSSIYLY
ncbi:MAG: hypothetical protein U1C73_02130 [Dietzia sp.]|nr:hypothetical protein [Dietzia sp.]